MASTPARAWARSCAPASRLIHQFDIVIKNGIVVDGTGAPRAGPTSRSRDGRVAAIGRPIDADAHEMIDAAGLIVTPGFVDAHALRRPGHLGHELGPTTWHGVTTTVMGNCGVGFAPVPPGASRASSS